MIILGIDPGTMVTGYGIINKSGSREEIIQFGSIRTSSRASFPKRLKRIYDSLSDIIQRNSIDVISLEEAFYAKNVKTTLSLGHARGVILLAAENAGIKVHEYSPREIKQSVTGNGAASKEQVQYMVQSILNYKDKIEPVDASDALAAAICHSNRPDYLS